MKISTNMLAMSVILVAASAGLAEVVPLTFGEGSNGPLPSGNHAWETPENWTSDNVPDDFVSSADGERAIVGNATADRTITTSTPLVFHGIQWSQSTPGVVNRIVLGDNWNSRHNTDSISNTSGSAANLVLDVNGNRADLNLAALTMTGAGWVMTFASSAPGGMVTADTIGVHANAVVGANVTMQANTAGASRLNGIWDINSTFQVRPTTTSGRIELISGDGIGNLVIGNGVNSQIVRGFETNSAARVRGNVTINADSTFVFHRDFATTLLVGGNFIDQNTGAASFNGGVHVQGAVLSDASDGSYGTTSGQNTIAFYNSPVTQRTVDIRRSLHNNFQVGSNFGGAGNNTFGNIGLDHDLTTDGSFRVLTGSIVNVKDHTLTAGSFIADANSRYGYTLGGDIGLIHVSDAGPGTGNLTLNDFIVDFVRAAGWVHGTDVVLFSYDGAFAGTPEISFGTTPHGFEYDDLVHQTFESGGGMVILTNVTLPEPAAGVMLLAGATLLLRRRSACMRA